jgi:hypothetical protein
MSIKKIIAIVLGMTSGLTLSIPAASAEGGGISQFIPNASEVVKATIVLTPPGLMTRAPLTERKLLEFGCQSSNDGRDISHLIDIISGNLQDDKGEVGKFYFRNAIYLKLGNGSVIKYIFSAAIHQNERIFGRADNGSGGDNSLFLAKSDFLKKLQEWSMAGSVEKKDAAWCLENNQQDVGGKK